LTISGKKDWLNLFVWKRKKTKKVGLKQQNNRSVASLQRVNLLNEAGAKLIRRKKAIRNRYKMMIRFFGSWMKKRTTPTISTSQSTKRLEKGKE